MDTAGRRALRRERWLQRGQRVSDAFGLVLLLVLTTYVLASLLSNQGWPGVVLIVAAGATSVVGLTGAHAHFGVVRAAILLSLLAIALAAVAAISGERAWLSAGSLIEVGLLAVSAGAVLIRVVTAQAVGSRTILGAISVYTVLGLLFTFLYGAIDRLEGGGFFAGGTSAHGSDFIFFSYTTLTTTGYGDLVPAGQPGRMIAGVEMMLGQIFLVTLVAGLVSLWRPGEALRRRRERHEREIAGGPGAAE
jgi:hypothetical protein